MGNNSTTKRLKRTDLVGARISELDTYDSVDISDHQLRSLVELLMGDRFKVVHRNGWVTLTTSTCRGDAFVAWSSDYLNPKCLDGMVLDNDVCAYLGTLLEVVWRDDVAGRTGLEAFVHPEVASLLRMLGEVIASGCEEGLVVDVFPRGDQRSEALNFNLVASECATFGQ